MRNFKMLLVLILMCLPLKSFSQVTSAQIVQELSMSELNIKVMNNHSLYISIPKSPIKVVRKIYIIGILDNCDEYCLNLNNKSEIVINDNFYSVILPKDSGKYLIRFTVEEITSSGYKKRYFSENYFNIM